MKKIITSVRRLFKKPQKPDRNTIYAWTTTFEDPECPGYVEEVTFYLKPIRDNNACLSVCGAFNASGGILNPEKYIAQIGKTRRHQLHGWITGWRRMKAPPTPITEEEMVAIKLKSPTTTILYLTKTILHLLTHD